jgi:LuxR family maltose regulon positive regulatory protein
MDDLLERTEGWPAGIYLAALSLRGHPSPHVFVRQFTGDNRFIVDFLAEEVLGRQPRAVRQFLARTCILGRFCAPLCDAVTESASAADLIEVLERKTCSSSRWTTPGSGTDITTCRRVLQRPARADRARPVPELHRRASARYAEHGSPGEAVSHAIAAGDFGYATGSSRTTGSATCVRVAVATVLADPPLGDEQIAASPVAAHCAAWAAALSGDRQTARGWLPVIDSAQDTRPLPDGMPSLRFSAALLRGVYGFEGPGDARVSHGGHRTRKGPHAPWYALARGVWVQPLHVRHGGSGRTAAGGGVRPGAAADAPRALDAVAHRDRGGRGCPAQELAQAARDVGQRDELRGHRRHPVLVADGAVRRAGTAARPAPNSSGR